MTRPELFVFLALSVGWLAIAGWAFRISRKVSRLEGAAPKADRPSH
jgi:hypothetical protein